MESQLKSRKTKPKIFGTKIFGNSQNKVTGCKSSILKNPKHLEITHRSLAREKISCVAWNFSRSSTRAKILLKTGVKSIKNFPQGKFFDPRHWFLDEKPEKWQKLMKKFWRKNFASIFLPYRPWFRAKNRKTQKKVENCWFLNRKISHFCAKFSSNNDSKGRWPLGGLKTEIFKKTVQFLKCKIFSKSWRQINKKKI